MALLRPAVRTKKDIEADLRPCLLRYVFRTLQTELYSTIAFFAIPCQLNSTYT